MNTLLTAFVIALFVSFVALAAAGYLAAASLALVTGFLFGAGLTSLPTPEERTEARQRAQATRQPENLPTNY